VTDSFDVVVVGGGVMGSASALGLARRGASVLVLEKSVPGAEASSAAAGILGAQVESHGPGRETDLCLASRALYPGFVEGLRAATGLEVGYRQAGTLRLAPTGKLAELGAAAAWQRKAGLAVEELGPSRLAEQVEGLGAGFEGGVWFAEDAQLDPPSLLRALQVAAIGAGVSYRSGSQVRRILVEDERATGVLLDDGTRISAGRVVLAAGSWSTLVEGVPLDPGAVKPARGQIVELQLRAPRFSCVVFGPGAYLVPRADGRVLVGSTLEFVGYHKDVTASAVRDLLGAAIAMVPALGASSVSRTWSNFRPFAAGGGPLLGASELRGLVLATGHHRNGILLAPVTGEIVAAACEGRSYEVPRRGWAAE
jgi:glycine oxidase